jgi:hypothetical protein
MALWTYPPGGREGLVVHRDGALDWGQRRLSTGPCGRSCGPINRSTVQV